MALSNSSRLSKIPTLPEHILPGILIFLQKWIRPHIVEVGTCSWICWLWANVYWFCMWLAWCLVKTDYLVHECRGQDNFIEHGHWAADQTSVAPLGTHGQPLVITVWENGGHFLCGTRFQYTTTVSWHEEINDCSQTNNKLNKRQYVYMIILICSYSDNYSTILFIVVLHGTIKYSYCIIVIRVIFSYIISISNECNKN